MGSEITGLDDRHAYLKLGNNVARFDFDYIDLPTATVGFLVRASTRTDGMSFNPETLEPRNPQPSNTRLNEEAGRAEPRALPADGSRKGPAADRLTPNPSALWRKGRSQGLFPWPKEVAQEPDSRRRKEAARA